MLKVITTPEDVSKYNKLVEGLLADVPAPDGFRRSQSVKEDDWGGQVVEVKFESEDVKIRIDAYLLSEKKIEKLPHTVYALANGHVDFDTKHGWRTFDLRGVDDSFYLYPGASVETIEAELAKQLQKVKDAQLRADTSVKVPGLAFSCLRTPAEVAQMAEDLQAGRTVRLAPGGFGTGHVLSTRRPRARYGVREASPELKKLMGVSTLWLENFDHD